MPRTEEQFHEIRERSKTQILNSSLKLFAEKGFKGTSISDIAKDAKISKGLIYNYFESKTAIVEAIYLHLLNEMQRMMEPIYQLKDPSEKLQRIINDTVQYTSENKDYWKLYLNFMLQPSPVKFEEVLNPKFFQKFFLEFEEIFTDAGVKEPKNMAYEFAAILDGMQMHILFMDDLYPLKEIQNYILNKYSKKELKKKK